MKLSHVGLWLFAAAASIATVACAEQTTQVDVVGSHDAARPRCKAGYGWDGTHCVGARVTTATQGTCPPSAVWTGSACVRR